MEEADTKICGNCKREIPLSNFTIHSVFCVRNIRICPVCKEPVLAQELQQHHDDQHKLVPCRQCGEDVCGTDMEDHIRDSCALTMQTCRFCSLDLHRRALPAHERYCRARTELCECGEWIMMKYRQLHNESNHGFIRLTDDPVPTQSMKTSVTKQKNAENKPTVTSNAFNNLNRQVKNCVLKLSDVAGPSGLNTNPNRPPTIALTSLENYKSKTENIRNFNGAVPRVKISDIHTGNDSTGKVRNSSSRGSMKKRPAPLPPSDAGIMLQRALQRRQQEEFGQRQQNQGNLYRGLPPVKAPAEQVERLQNMKSLHNKKTDDQSWKNRLQGRGGSRAEVRPIGRGGTGKSEVNGEVRKELKNLKPMTSEEFLNKYRDLQAERQDRFNDIKTSLTELRRGLNEVTSPYNLNSNTPDSNQNRHDEEAPCEFCGNNVLLEDLVLHESGCRTDLAQYNSPSPSSSTSAAAGLPPSGASYSPEPTAPLIPCEFCARPLPVHLVSHHQEWCGRERNMMFPE